MLAAEVFTREGANMFSWLGVVFAMMFKNPNRCSKCGSGSTHPFPHGYPALECDDCGEVFCS